MISGCAASTGPWTLPDAQQVWHHHGTPTGCDYFFWEQDMSARKLSRFAGLVFVLAAIFGGVGAASAVAEHGAGGTTETAAVQSQLTDINWG